LLVRLPKTGAVILSGDLVHFEDNWQRRMVPARNFNRKQTLQSMERIQRLMEDEPAQLWINHDKAQSDGIAHAPRFVE
jgi:glyoxylase-like metal-dependent hydrolase (beta-lactamase superfamily II)